MKKLLFAAAVATMLAGCSKDLTSDTTIDKNINDSEIDFHGGIAIEASAGETTRVTVDGDTASATSRMAWEAGDEIIVAYDGRTYVYVAQNAGATSTFAPKDADNAIMAIDPAQDVAAFYNVAEVDAAAKTATFGIAAEQHEGEASNKLPLCAYDESARYADGKILLTMKPLASIVEFEVKSSADWNADALSLAPSARAAFTGYTSVENAKVDPRSGEIDLASADVSNEAIRVAFGGMKNFNGSKNVQAVVGAACFGGIPETVEGASAYAGGAVVKLYKNGRENFRRTIWTAEEKLVDLTTGRKHVYQPLADILAGHRNGISTADDMKAFADEINNATETFPVGTGFCNEDGTVVLNNDIDLSAFDNWTTMGYNGDGSLNGVEIVFNGVFDGQNNTVSGLNIVHRTYSHPIEYTDAAGVVQTVYNNCAGLFGAISDDAEIMNLTVEGTILEDYTDPNGTWSYAGGITAQMYGGTIRNCTSETIVSVGAGSSAKTRIGGIAGRIAASHGDCRIENCTNRGNLNIAFPVYKAQQAIVGGCFGIIADDAAGNTISVSGCSNRGEITLTNSGNDSYVGGIVGYATRAKGIDGTLDNLRNYGKVSGGDTSGTSFYVGGIAARINYHTFTDCVNEAGADVSFIGAAASTTEIGVGGIVGVTNNANNTATAVIENCSNHAAVSIPKTVCKAAYVGGIAGYLRYRAELNACDNDGTVSLGEATGQAFTGGIAGKVGVASIGTADGILISDCTNSGEVMSASAYTAGWDYIGGIAGALYGGTNVAESDGYGITVSGCINNGTVRMLDDVKSKYRGGGITGLTNRANVLSCTNNGIVVIDRTSAVSEHLGGIVGFSENNKSAIGSCINAGTVCCTQKTTYENGSVTSNIYVSLGGILGSGGGAKVTIDNCTSKGDILMAASDCDHQYRGSISSTPTNGIVISNCKVGGRVGVVAAGSETFTPDETATHALNDTVGDPYYWESWIIGYNRVPEYSNNSFYTGR